MRLIKVASKKARCVLVERISMPLGRSFGFGGGGVEGLEGNGEEWWRMEGNGQGWRGMEGNRAG